MLRRRGLVAVFGFVFVCICLNASDCFANSSEQSVIEPIAVRSVPRPNAPHPLTSSPKVLNDETENQSDKQEIPAPDVHPLPPAIAYEMGKMSDDEPPSSSEHGGDDANILYPDDEIPFRLTPTIVAESLVKVSKFDFDVDAVYTWYNSHDQNSQRERLKYMEAEGHDKWGNSAVRYTDVGELKYSLRGIEMNAPWIRKIFVVIADNQPPPTWLKETDRLKVIRHSQIFTGGDERFLPVFSSVAIETELHKIPGLAEHWIYFNDDMMISRPVDKSVFFHEDGRPHIWYSYDWRFPADSSKYDMHDAMEHNALDAAKKHLSMNGVHLRYPELQYTRLAHHCKAVTRKMMWQCSKHLPAEMEETRRNRFRSKKAMYAMAAASQLCIQTDQCVVMAIPANYAANLNQKPAHEMKAEILAQNPKLLCVNNSQPGDEAAVQDMLETVFPKRSSFEK